MSKTPELVTSNVITRDPETLIICRNLAYSRSQLLKKEIPMQLRVTTYLRISCSSLQKLNKLGKYGIEIELQNPEYPLLSGKLLVSELTQVNDLECVTPITVLSSRILEMALGLGQFRYGLPDASDAVGEFSKRPLVV